MRGSSLSAMAQRFNAPPGWNVPPDFVPTSDWKPDPSWPPAPEGWNYWVDDAPAAAPQQPAYGAPTPHQPAYGAPTPQPYGAASPAAPYGSAPGAMPAGAPVGAYGSTAPGSAHSAVATAQQSGARKSIIIGAVLFVGAILVTVVSYSMAGPGDRYFVPWYFALLGIILVIRGLIEQNKAKKALAAAQGPYGVGGPLPGVTPPGTTPPGQNPPGTF